MRLLQLLLLGLLATSALGVQKVKELQSGECLGAVKDCLTKRRWRGQWGAPAMFCAPLHFTTKAPPALLEFALRRRMSKRRGDSRAGPVRRLEE